MQPHNSDDQRTAQGNPDGGRNAQQSPAENALGLVLALLADAANRAVHLAEPGKPVNLSATLTGSGRASA